MHTKKKLKKNETKNVLKLFMPTYHRHILFVKHFYLYFFFVSSLIILTSECLCVCVNRLRSWNFMICVGCAGNVFCIRGQHIGFWLFTEYISYCLYGHTADLYWQSFKPIFAKKETAALRPTTISGHNNY